MVIFIAKKEEKKVPPNVAKIYKCIIIRIRITTIINHNKNNDNNNNNNYNNNNKNNVTNIYIYIYTSFCSSNLPAAPVTWSHL